MSTRPLLAALFFAASATAFVTLHRRAVVRSLVAHQPILISGLRSPKCCSDPACVIDQERAALRGLLQRIEAAA